MTVLSAAIPQKTSFYSVGWLSGQKQRSVKPSGYALHRFESYPYQKYNPAQAGFIFYDSTIYLKNQLNIRGLFFVR